MLRIKEKKHLEFFALMLGGFFLCNPIIGFYDVLPDLIGYILICFGLWKLSDLNDDFAESLRLFRGMLWISAGQSAMQWVIYEFLPTFANEIGDDGQMINPYERPMLILLVTFVWAVLNWCFLIPAIKHLFAGFGTVALQGQKYAIGVERRGRALWSRVGRKSICVAAILPALSLLPELSILTTMNLKSDTPTVSFDWYQYISMFRTVLGIVAGIVGILWLITFMRFFVKMLCDQAFCDLLSEKYRTEVLPRQKWLAYRRWSMAITVITVGLLFSLNIRIDGKPLFLGAISAILLCVGSLLLGQNKIKYLLPLFVTGVVTSVISAIHWKLITAYLTDHLPQDALHVPRAYNKFLVIRWMEFAEEILTFLLLFIFFVLIWQAILHLEKTMDVALLGKDRKKYQIKWFSIVGVSLVMTVVNCIHAFLQLEIKYLWLISLFLFVIMFFLFRSFMLEILDELFSYTMHERVNKSEERETY